MVGGTPAHLGAGPFPLLAHVGLRGWWPLPVDPRDPPGGPGTLPIKPETFPVTKTGLPIYKSLPPDHSGTPRDVRDLIRDSEQHRSQNHITHIILNQHRALSVRTLRVRELCRHDRDTSPVNNQLRNLDAYIGSYIFYEYLYRSNRHDNIRNSLCPSVCYLPEIRSSVSRYLVQSRY